ncbi:MAG: von Willebrand factor type A domain-containing protein [Cyclobacteriaceae bacterium]|nr:hypothetical protein [Cytophagales bacterium]HNP77875.1 von Willebrand factor type A domain-containing protein [Cyclobacteriaceae bacterium]
MKKIWLLLILILVAGVSLISAQTRTISGRITADEDGSPLPGVIVTVKGTSIRVHSDAQGKYAIQVPVGKNATLVFSFTGMTTVEVPTDIRNEINVVMKMDVHALSEVIVTAQGIAREEKALGNATTSSDRRYKKDHYSQPAPVEFEPAFNTEEYDFINENGFRPAKENPLSTFSIDVDAASYSNVRRFLQNGQLPPADAVRVEEMINYFDYTYEQPKNDHPFSVSTEISSSPWNEKRRLVHIGLQGKVIPTENLPASNLVFLIDVSGSMEAPNKLPLLKASFRMLTQQLREQDHVAIVVYAGAAGLVLPSTSGANKQAILTALDNLQAGGSTAGGAGIELAYKIARENFKQGGNNRVVLATDGDFNVGESSNGGMERLIEAKRRDGVFLTVLGFGMGNYKDSKMEILADKGNGNYAYIDNLQEAQKVLVNEFGGTMFTIAKDVKIQVEFNPARVKAYRLIGYENRALRNEDFNNDKKDAGELGSGHSVTALYEIIPADSDESVDSIDPLKYQRTRPAKEVAVSDELLTIKLRYKLPEEEKSRLIVHPLVDTHTALAKTSANFRWSAAVAGFGMLLRGSEYVKGYRYDDVAMLAQGARGTDQFGYQTEFISLVKSMSSIGSR